MKISYFFFAFALSFSVFGEMERPPEASAKKAIEAAPNAQVNSRVGTIPLEGIILAPSDQLPDKIPQEHGIHVRLGPGDYLFINQVLQNYLNRPLTGELLREIRTVITDAFLQQKGRYVAVLIPVQDVTDGVVVFQILPGTIGQIHFRGQRWFSEETLRKPLHMKKGDPIVEERMMDYMSWINRNPFRRMQLIVSPGVEKGTTDVEFVTRDRFPLRFYTGSDNTGYRPTGQVRLYGGINWGNALKNGDLLSYQYTASTNFHEFQSHVLSYTTYLPWRHVLTAFGCYGIVFPQITGFTSSGKNIQTSGRYSIPFSPLFGDFTHHLDFGFDWKFISSNFFFAADPQQALAAGGSKDIINVTQFLVSYGLQKNWPNQVLTFAANLFASVWKDLLPHQSSMAYDHLRPGSHVRYSYLRASAGHRYKLPIECVLSSLFRGQLASCTLPTSEQFGLGGEDTVRGYFEQQFVADNALLFNIEFYSKPLSLFKAQKNELTFLAFFDYGYGRNYSYSSEEFKQQHLIGIGPGLRYDIMPYFNLKMDYGFQLIGVPGDFRTGRFHFSVNVSN